MVEPFNQLAEMSSYSPAFSKGGDLLLCLASLKRQRSAVKLTTGHNSIREQGQLAVEMIPFFAANINWQRLAEIGCYKRHHRLYLQMRLPNSQCISSFKVAYQSSKRLNNLVVSGVSLPVSLRGI